MFAHKSSLAKAVRVKIWLSLVVLLCAATLPRAACDESPEKTPEAATKSTPENSTPLSTADDPQDVLAGARISLALHDAPLLQVVGLLELATPARFRWGAPPDVVVSPQINDELLLPSLDKMLGDAKWRMQREGGELFLLPREEKNVRWSLWGGENMPPRGWASPEPLKPVNIDVAHAPRNSTPESKPRWHPAYPVSVDGRQRPAFGLRLLPSMITGKESGDGQIFLRRRFSLSFVPAGARLLLALPGSVKASTVFVNGAPLLRNVKGMQMIDVSRALQRGDNVLALQLKLRKPEPVMMPGQMPIPIGDIGYEWFFSGEPGGAASVQNGDEGG